MLRLFAKRWQRELATFVYTSDMVEVPSEHDSGCDLDDNLYLHFNYSIQKNCFLESKMGERKSKIGNGKSKIGRFIEHKRKAK